MIKKIVLLFILISMIGIIILNVHSCGEEYYEENYSSFISSPDIEMTPFERSWLYYGVKEFASRQDESIINNFIADVTASVTGNETAWCSAFINSVCIRSGYEFSNSLAARSWLKIGYDVSDNPKPGDIVVLWRKSPSSWQGHVGFLLRENKDKTKVLLMGGNQSNSVVPQWYPSNRILGFRRVCKAYQDENAFQTIDPELSKYIN